MLNLFYKGVTPWAIANKRQIITNRVLGRLANYIYPIYCKLNNIDINRTVLTNGLEKKVIVSLTSFPERIDKVYLTINTLLRQSVLPNKIILWLAKSQFKDPGYIPKNLSSLEGNLFEIRYCEDLKSYKKIFYTAQEYYDDIIVTVDDDTLYPENWLENLIKTYLDYPDCVCCYRAHKIVSKSGKTLPYMQWLGLSPDQKGPDFSLIPIGVGGILYPPYFFENVDFDYRKISELCPTSDDLWLKALAILNGYKAVKVFQNSKEWFTITSSQKVSLNDTNVRNSANDEAISKLQRYYKINLYGNG